MADLLRDNVSAELPLLRVLQEAPDVVVGSDEHTRHSGQHVNVQARDGARGLEDSHANVVEVDHEV